MARTAIAILTPRARRANVSRWVEAMERGRKPHANIPMETSIDTGTHPTCSADVLPIPCCTNRSGPTGPGSFPTPPISDRAARTVQTALLACAAAGYVRGGLRPRAGMWVLREPAPVSKKRRVSECGKTPPAPASKKQRTRRNVCRIWCVNNHVTRRYLYGSVRCRNSTLHRKPSRTNRTTNLGLFCCELSRPDSTLR